MLTIDKINRVFQHRHMLCDELWKPILREDGRIHYKVNRENLEYKLLASPWLDIGHTLFSGEALVEMDATPYLQTCGKYHYKVLSQTPFTMGVELVHAYLTVWVEGDEYVGFVKLHKYAHTQMMTIFNYEMKVFEENDQNKQTISPLVETPIYLYNTHDRCVKKKVVDLLISNGHMKLIWNKDTVVNK